MIRSMVALIFGIAIMISSLASAAQQNDSGPQKQLDVQSSAGDLHVGSDADARKTGLPLYPGARLRRDKENNEGLNFGVLTQAFGVKLVVAKYESDDEPGKVIDYYRERLKKYGKVIECHVREHGGGADAEISDDEDSKELKCEGDNTGPVTELKVGTQDEQHVVAVEANKDARGSNFALVYLHARGKKGDI